MQGNLLVAQRDRLPGHPAVQDRRQGLQLRRRPRLEPIVSSTDPNFRPADVEVGPDGALYFIDWHNPIIGHMQHNLRDPSRDRTHGRVYRVTYEGRAAARSRAKIAGEPIEKLLDLLKEPEDRVRYRARIELSGRDSDEVIAAADEVDRRRSTRTTPTTSTTCWKACGCTSTTTSSTRRC